MLNEICEKEGERRRERGRREREREREREMGYLRMDVETCDGISARMVLTYLLYLLLVIFEKYLYNNVKLIIC